MTRVLRENNNQWYYVYDSKSQVSAATKRRVSGNAEALKGNQTTYAYDQIGNRTLVSESTSPATALSYETNALNQYTEINFPSQTFDVSGFRSSSSANILVYPNGGSGVTPDYQPASTGLYFWKRLAHGSGTDPYDLAEVRENGTTLDYGYQFVPPASVVPTYDADGNLSIWTEKSQRSQLHFRPARA